MGAKDTVIVTWDERYSVGMSEIDAQHQALFETINRLWSAIVDKSNREQILMLIDELERYTVAHFSAEEKFMESTAYPDLAAHRQLHQTFVQRIATERQDVSAGKSISLDLLRFLKDWLVQHIQVEDQRYAAHCRQDPQRSSGLSGLFKRFWA